MPRELEDKQLGNFLFPLLHETYSHYVSIVYQPRLAISVMIAMIVLFTRHHLVPNVFFHFGLSVQHMTKHKKQFKPNLEYPDEQILIRTSLDTISWAMWRRYSQVSVEKSGEKRKVRNQR